MSDDPRDRSETVVSPSKLVEETTVCSNKLEIEISPIISEFSSLSKVKAKNTKLEDNRSIPGSTSGVAGHVCDDPRDKEEAIVSSCELLDEIQFQFSDTISFADGKTLDDVVANKASGAGVHDESDCNVDVEGGNDIDLEIKPENHYDLSRPQTSLIPIPGSELHLGDNNLEAKSLPNLRSHIQDLVCSDSFQVSCSLCNSESSPVAPVNGKVSSFPEQELEGTSESKENSGSAELMNNPVPDDKNSDDLKVDSFSPFVGEFILPI
jgi:phosphatidate phosphatase LPIN